MMYRLFLPSVNIKNINKNKEEIKKYLIKEIKNKKILSSEGIMQISNKDENIYYLEIVDGPVENYFINNIEFILDNSYWIENEKNLCWQIPENHIELNITKFIYKLNKTSPLELVIEKQENNITDFYFTMNKKNEYFDWHNDVLTFIDILNIC